MSVSRAHRTIGGSLNRSVKPLPSAKDHGFCCDNDAKYGSRFEHAVNGANIEIIHTPLCSPQANAICERFIGSVRRECLDFVLILSEHHARRIMQAYIAFFNRARPHQGIEQRIPEPSATAPLPDTSPLKVDSWPILGGLHHDYRWVA